MAKHPSAPGPDSPRLCVCTLVAAAVADPYASLVIVLFLESSLMIDVFSIVCIASSSVRTCTDHRPPNDAINDHKLD